MSDVSDVRLVQVTQLSDSGEERVDAHYGSGDDSLEASGGHSSQSM